MDWIKRPSRTAAYSWSFGPAFLVDLEKAIQKSVEEGLKDGTLEEIWEDVFGEKFPKDADGNPMAADVLVQTLMEKAEKVNTVSDLESPLEVWISEDGIYSVMVEDQRTKKAAVHIFKVTYMDENGVMLPEKKEVQVPEEVIAESRKQRTLGPVVDWIEESQDAAVYTIEEIV